VKLAGDTKIFEEGQLGNTPGVQPGVIACVHACLRACMRACVRACGRMLAAVAFTPNHTTVFEEGQLGHTRAAWGEIACVRACVQANVCACMHAGSERMLVGVYARAAVCRCICMQGCWLRWLIADALCRGHVHAAAAAAMLTGGCTSVLMLCCCRRWRAHHVP
jgi:hypothetical protein